MAVNKDIALLHHNYKIKILIKEIIHKNSLCMLPLNEDFIIGAYVLDG